MGFKKTVKKNGMTGDLYFVIVSSEDMKMQGISNVRLRSFESREAVKSALKGELETEFVTDEVVIVPLDEDKNLTTKDAYEYIKKHHHPDAIDVIE